MFFFFTFCLNFFCWNSYFKFQSPLFLKNVNKKKFSRELGNYVYFKYFFFYICFIWNYSDKPLVSGIGVATRHGMSRKSKSKRWIFHEILIKMWFLKFQNTYYFTQNYILLHHSQTPNILHKFCIWFKPGNPHVKWVYMPFSVFNKNNKVTKTK